MSIRPVTMNDLEGWHSMRAGLWPETPESDHIREMPQLLAAPDRNAVFLCESAQGAPLGFIEAGVRAYAENGDFSA